MEPSVVFTGEAVVVVASCGPRGLPACQNLRETDANANILAGGGVRVAGSLGV